MHLSLLKHGAAALLFASSLVAAALTSSEIADQINDLREDTVAVQALASVIGPINELDYFLGRGAVYDLQLGLEDLASKTTSLDTSIQGTPAFTSSVDADAIEDAFGVLANSVETLFLTIAAKSLVFRVVPVVGLNVVDAVRAVENAVNDLGASLVDLVADFGEQVAYLESFVAAVDDAADTAADNLNGLTIS